MDDLIKAALVSKDPMALQLAYRMARHPLTRFKPRPDQPELLDQQTSFYKDKFPGIACVLAGNGAGKSFVASAKTADFLLNTPPPEPNTPFWVVSTTMDLVTGNCWGQNLSHFIPPESIAGTVWHSSSRSLPRAVILKPHRNGNNFCIEFKSYDQGRERLQAANIAGFWIDEWLPFEVLMELWARTRKWTFPGSRIYSLTPLEPDTKLESLFHDPPESWQFYRMNTRCNDTLDPDFVKQITENEIAELVETRLTGAFARYEGAIYPTFSLTSHVTAPIPLNPNWTHYRGIDPGWDHPTACVWAARDEQGRYYVYKEMLKRQTSIEDLVAAMNDGWDNVHQGRTYADYAAAQVLAEFRKRGLSCVSANKEVKAGIATMQSLLRMAPDGKPRLIIFDSCPNLIRQLRTYVWDKKRNDQPKKEDDDLSDALRYLVHSYRVQQEKVAQPRLSPEERLRQAEERALWAETP